MSVTLIGDVHDKYQKYLAIASKKEYTIQLGDFSTRASDWHKLSQSGLSPKKHKVIPGNHEDYDVCLDSPNCLGDYGHRELNGIEFYFIRGGISIDRVYRIGEELGGGPKSYSSKEELNFDQMVDCMDDYKLYFKDIVLSHVPPASVINEVHGNKGNTILQKYKFHVGFQENTSLLCEKLLKIHSPKLWIFGHHHRKFDKTINGTRFICLPELETFELE